MILNILSFIFTFHAFASQEQNPFSYSQYPQLSYGNSCFDPNWDSKCMCDQQAKKIAWVQSHGKKLTHFDWSDIQSKKLVMIGDAHAVTNPDSILTLLEYSRAKTGLQCVFLEIPSDYSTAQLLRLVRQKSENSESTRLRRYYEKIATGALNLGFKLFMVDDPGNRPGKAPVSDFDREAHMAKTIQNIFQSRKCDRAVLIVGKAHIAVQYYNGDNLTERLKKLEISLVRLNPIHAPNAGRKAPQEEWNGICEKQTWNPPEALIFESSGVRDLLVMPGFTVPLSVVTFRDFDYSILFPDRQFK